MTADLNARATHELDLFITNLEWAADTGCRFLAGVNSRRGPWSHVVVAMGRRVIHDPSAGRMAELGLAPYTWDDVRPDLLEGTNLIRHWLVGRTVDSVGLAAELRQWADTFQPTDLPDGVSPWLGDEADAVALGHIVQTLPDDEWERSCVHMVWINDPRYPNAAADGQEVYLLRRKPQTVTVELPKSVAEAMCDEVNIDYHTVAAACRKALGR